MGGTDVGQFLTTICLYIRCIIVVVSGYCSYGRGLDNGLEIGVDDSASIPESLYSAS